jgi:NitT/TauT family transport system ATP-binding protein
VNSVTALLPTFQGDALTSNVAGNTSPTGEPSHTEVVLSFEGVGKSFGTSIAVQDVSLSVAAGEFVAVVGPSGCGKSTLLRMASGLSTPSSGRLMVTDADIGYVFQDATLLPWRTVERNLELFGELDKVPKAERRARARDALELTGLTGFEKHRPRQLSGGMRMRVSLARALSLHPKLFLLDEPFASLDEITRERLNDELLAIYQRERFGVVFVTHSVAEAAYLAQRVVVMSSRPGRIVDVITVPAGYPRSSELRFDPEFVAVTARISIALKNASQ